MDDSTHTPGTDLPAKPLDASGGDNASHLPGVPGGTGLNTSDAPADHAACPVISKKQRSSQGIGKKVGEKGFKSGAKMPFEGHHPASLDHSSQDGQPAARPDAAYSTNGQPHVEPGTEDVPAQRAGSGKLPPAGLRNGKADKARQRSQAGTQPGPPRKKQKPGPGHDVSNSRASSQVSMEDSQPADSNASSCPPQTARTGKSGGKANGKSRKVMSLHAASQDASLDKSPLQAARPVSVRSDAENSAQTGCNNFHESDPRHGLGVNGSNPVSNGGASEMGRPTAAPPLLSDPQLKQETADADAAEPQRTSAPGNDPGLLAVPKHSRKPCVAASSSKVSVLSKRYGSTFIWAQLSGWFKQTVYDPTASLSAERRGTISLPDLESCYGTAKQRYTAKVRAAPQAITHPCPDADGLYALWVAALCLLASWLGARIRPPGTI